VAKRSGRLGDGMADERVSVFACMGQFGAYLSGVANSGYSERQWGRREQHFVVRRGDRGTTALEMEWNEFFESRRFRKGDVRLDYATVEDLEGLNSPSQPSSAKDSSVQ
jgi:hypothetical protein